VSANVLRQPAHFARQYLEKRGVYTGTPEFIGDDSGASGR